MGMFNKNEKVHESYDVENDVPTYSGPDYEGVTSDNADNLHRSLGNRQIQLIAIGGSIGMLQRTLRLF